MIDTWLLEIITVNDFYSVKVKSAIGAVHKRIRLDDLIDTCDDS
jgi:hypothetical protein